MATDDGSHIIASLEALEALYGEPGEASLVKVTGRVIPEYAALIEASPFAALATVGPEGIDCSPRATSRVLSASMMSGR